MVETFDQNVKLWAINEERKKTDQTIYLIQIDVQHFVIKPEKHSNMLF